MNSSIPSIVLSKDLARNADDDGSCHDVNYIFYRIFASIIDVFFFFLVLSYVYVAIFDGLRSEI